jgi:hypothetical protein
LIMSTEHYIDNSESFAGSILETLAYFDVFSHPLTLQEIRDFNPVPGCTVAAVEMALAGLMAKRLVHESGGYYFLGEDRHVVVDRIKANALAQERMRAAWFHSSLIARFPFVRAVFISGSLSKGVMDTDDDIDFFIITAPGRLWMARVMLTLFKRVFLLNSHRNFCLNYFIDTDHLLIPDRNVFTATEIGLILPMYNRDLYLEFLGANSWFRSFYPNLLPVETVRDHPKKFAGVIIEKLLSGKRGDRLDDICLQVTRRFLARKHQDMEPGRFQSDLETSKGVSRHHPNRQQFRILGRYEETVRRLQNRMPETVPAGRMSAEYGKSA